MSGFRLFDLNPEQELAVRTTEGPLLILAGAGTGKTRVITARVAYIISQGTPPEKVLAVTFTNKAANEMRERLASLIPSDQAKKVLMSTFHALCVRILRQDIEKLGYKKNFSIYDEGDQMGLIKKIITKVAARDEKLDANAAKNMISKAKNNGWREPDDGRTLVGAVFARYQAELKTLNAVDFDDLLLLTVKLLSEHADVRERWHLRYRYLMVDEFQDTNRLQLDLISLIAIGPNKGGNHRPNVAVVGDDDQSIYGWRGAEVTNILEFENHFPNPTVVKLEQNYRSTNAILNTANVLIKNNPRRRAKNLWSAQDGGSKVRIVAMSDDRQEAEFIANEIQQRSVVEAAKHDDFAILFRMNAQSRLIETNLRQLQIPYRIIGGKSFFDRREVKDLIAYGNCLVNADDDVSLLRIINTPARGISPNTVENATEFSTRNKCSVFEAMRSPVFREKLMKRAADAIDKFSEFIDTYETKLNEPLANQPAVLKELIKETGYLEELRRTCKTPEEALSRENNIHELLKSFEDYTGRATGGLRGFLDEMSLRQERQEEDNEMKGTGVTLITLHAAKGLEFPHVYLIGLEEGLLPHDRSKVEGTVDEERRLLYVGITRARQTLALTWCRNRMKYGSAMPCAASSFVKELPPETIEHTNATQILNAPVEVSTAKSRFSALKALIDSKPG